MRSANFFGCKQADKVDVMQVMERVKKETRTRMDRLTGLNLNDQNLIKQSSNTCC